MNLEELKKTYAPTLSKIEKEWEDFRYPDDYVLFVGDSFFDQHGFWNDFSRTFQGQRVFTIGVAATTAQEWFYLYPLLLKNKNPRRIAFHLGTNDINDDGCSGVEAYQRILLFLQEIRREHSKTPFYYFGIEPSIVFEKNIGKEKDLNQLLKNHEKEDPFFHFLDSPSHFFLSLGHPQESLYKDGLHPIDECYLSIYVSLLKKEGFFLF